MKSKCNVKSLSLNNMKNNEFNIAAEIAPNEGNS